MEVGLLWIQEETLLSTLYSEESSFLLLTQPVVALVSAAPDPPCISSSRASLASYLLIAVTSMFHLLPGLENLSLSTCVSGIHSIVQFVRHPGCLGNMWFGGLPLSWDLQVGVFSWKGHWKGRQCCDITIHYECIHFTNSD